MGGILIMTTYPNQNIVTIEKEATDANNLYAKINLKAIQLAMKDLNGTQFTVWMYFAKNKAGYEFAVSPRDAMDNYGISKNTFYRALDVLKEKGYLVPDEEKGAKHWLFREVPEDDNIYITKIEPAKEFEF